MIRKTAKTSSSFLWSSDLVTAVLSVAAGLTVLGLIAAVLHKTPLQTLADCPATTGGSFAGTIDNTACPPRDSRGCQSGALITTTDGTSLCDYHNHAVGTACSSACHVEDTDTACTSDQACDSADPTTCLGYCVSESESTTPGEGCEDKLTFLSYFTWGSAESSCESMSWLYYSDYDPECHQNEGCRWYATVMQLRGRSNTYFNSQTSTYDGCLDMLNMTNVGCIRAYRLNFTESFATALFHSIFEGDPDVANPNFIYSGYGCIYNYACGVRNETFMSDPENLLKRQVLPSYESRISELVKAHAPVMRRRWEAPVQRMKRVTCNI